MASASVETELIHLLRKFLVIVIPLFVLSLKLLMRLFSREDPREILRTLPALPLDLTLIGIGLMLTALARLNPAYFARFESDSAANLWAGLTLFGLFLSGVILNYLIGLSRILGQKLHTAYIQFD